MLIDAGLAGSELLRRIEGAGLDPLAVRGLVLTHEHRDHAAGLGVWARRHKVPVYLAQGMARALEKVFGPAFLAKVEVVEYEPGEAFTVGDLEFSAFPTSHDAERSVGFRVTDGVSTLGFATDLGVVTELAASMLREAELLYLEANHDMELLMGGPYPYFLKERIRGSRGHLSNVQCAELLENILCQRTKAVVLSHLSETNNQPHLAFNAARAVLEKEDAYKEVTLLVARQDRPGRVVKIP